MSTTSEFSLLVWAIGLWFLFILVVAATVALYRRITGRSRTLVTQELPFKLSSADVALELAGSADNVCKVIGNRVGTPQRAHLVENVVVDFVLIFWYAVLFVSFGGLVTRSTASGMLAGSVLPDVARSHGVLGIIIAVGGLLTALFDVMENRGMLDLLRRPIPETSSGQWTAGDRSAHTALDDVDARARSVRRHSLAKWLLLFVVSLMLGVALLDASGLLVVFAGCYLAVGASGLFSLAWLGWKLDGRPLQQAFRLVALLSLALGIVMAIWPDWVASSLDVR